MKTWALGLLCLASLANAQTPNADKTAPDQGAMKSVLTYLLTSASVENDFYQLQKNNLSTGKYTLGVGLNGQLFNLLGSDSDRMLSYELKLSSEGRKFIRVGFIELQRLLDKKSQTTIDLRFLTFEYKKNFDFSEQRESYVSLITVEAQKILVGTQASEWKLRGTAGFTAGFSGKLKTPEINIKGSAQGGIGLAGGLKYGLTASKSISASSSLNFGITASNHLRAYSSHLSPEAETRRSAELADFRALSNETSLAQKQWDADKFDWEVAHGYVNSASDEHYLAASGAAPRPKTPKMSCSEDDYCWNQNVLRKTFVLNPSLDYTKTLQNGNILRVGMRANLSMKDRMKAKRGKPYDAYTISDALKEEDYVKKNLAKDHPSSRVSINVTFTFGKNKAKAVDRGTNGGF